MTTVRILGMAVSRAMAVVVLMAAVRSFFDVLSAWLLEASQRQDHGRSGSLVMLALLLTMGGCFLWFRPDVFAGSSAGDPESGEDLIPAKTVARALLVGVGAYYALGGVAGLIYRAIPTSGGVSERLILGLRPATLSIAFEVIAGAALCYVSTRPTREAK